jgi:hypothetical protein
VGKWLEDVEAAFPTTSSPSPTSVAAPGRRKVTLASPAASRRYRVKDVSTDLDHSPTSSALLPKKSAVVPNLSEDEIGLLTPEPQGGLRRFSTNDRLYGKGGTAGAASVPVLSQSGSVPIPGRSATLPSSPRSITPIPQAGPSGIRTRHPSEVGVGINNGGTPGRRQRDEPRKTITVEEDDKGVTRYVGLFFSPFIGSILIPLEIFVFSSLATA